MSDLAGVPDVAALLDEYRSARAWALALYDDLDNVFLAVPPPIGLVQVLLAAAENQAVADAFADGAANPHRPGNC